MNQDTILKLLGYTGYTPLPAIVKPIYEGLGFIMLFHNTAPFSDGNYLENGFYQRNISPEKLDSIINYFRKKHYTFVSMDELHEILETGAVKRRIISITLDDGMLDNYLYAYPVFKSHNVPFTVYIPTKFIGSSEVLWTIPLEKFLIINNRIELTGIYGKLNLPAETNKEKNRLLRKIILETEQNGAYSDLAALFEHNGWYGYREIGRSYMNWDEVTELSNDELCTIGSHTVNHLMLSRLTEHEAACELTESKRMIESHINKPVNHLAYPYGTKIAVGEREFCLTEKCGYKTAVTVRYANIHPEHGKYLHCLPRYTMKPGFNDNILSLIGTGTFQFLLKKGKRIVTGN